MERKAVETFTADVEGRTVSGFASVFGVVDSYNDIVHPGAFAKTIKEGRSRFRHLWQHDAFAPPIATIKDVKEVERGELPAKVTERYPEASGGLLVVREYLSTPRADEVLAGLKADPAAITELSFGYDPVKFDFEETKKGDKYAPLLRNLREVRLYDTSDVNWGANPATANIKSTPQAAALVAEVNLLLAQAEGYKEGRVLSARNLGKLKDALAMLQEVLTAAEPPEEETPKALTVQGLLARLAIAEREFAFLPRLN